MLFEEAIKLFLENCKALDRRDSTIHSYQLYLTKFDDFISEEYNRPLMVDEVKPEDLQRFMFQKYNPKDYSSSVRHNIITAFKSLYSYLDRKGYCENKGKLINSEKVNTNERETISEIEFRKVVIQIKTPTARAVLYTLYYAGLRIQEALNLKLEDVDLEEEVFHIKDTKNKEDRTIPINNKLKKILEDYRNFGREDRNTDNFFSTYPLGQICPQQINKHLRKALQKAGIEKRITAHNLRHSFASNLVQRGVDVITLRTLLGHKNLRTTSIYCHTSLDELQEAVDVL